MRRMGDASPSERCYGLARLRCAHKGSAAACCFGQGRRARLAHREITRPASQDEPQDAQAGSGDAGLDGPRRLKEMRQQRLKTNLECGEIVG